MVNTMNQVAASSTQTDDNQIPYSIFRKVKYKRLWTIYFRENTNDNLMEIEISVYEKIHSLILKLMEFFEFNHVSFLCSVLQIH